MKLMNTSLFKKLFSYCYLSYLSSLLTCVFSVGCQKLKQLLSFAIGGLLGDVFLHLLPEAWANSGSSGVSSFHQYHITAFVFDVFIISLTHFSWLNMRITVLVEMISFGNSSTSGII